MRRRVTELTEGRKEKLLQLLKSPRVDIKKIQAALSVDSLILKEWADKYTDIRPLLLPHLSSIGDIKPIYDEEIHPKVVYQHLKSAGSKIGAAGKLGIDVATLEHWYSKYPSFRMAFDRGYAAGQAAIDDNVSSRLDNQMDHKALELSCERSNTAYIRDPLTGDTARELMYKVFERFQEDNPVITSRDLSAVVNILEKTCAAEELIKLQEQIEQVKREVE